MIFHVIISILWCVSLITFITCSYRLLFYYFTLCISIAINITLDNESESFEEVSFMVWHRCITISNFLYLNRFSFIRVNFSFWNRHHILQSLISISNHINPTNIGPELSNKPYRFLWHMTKYNHWYTFEKWNAKNCFQFLIIHCYNWEWQ